MKLIPVKLEAHDSFVLKSLFINNTNGIGRIAIDPSFSFDIHPFTHKQNLAFNLSGCFYCNNGPTMYIIVNTTEWFEIEYNHTEYQLVDALLLDLIPYMMESPMFTSEELIMYCDVLTKL
jgi:hypothetical protein